MGDSDYNEINIPREVKIDAELGNLMIKKGFAGGTGTGKSRGKQLARKKKISYYDLAEMRTWFSRHGPDANNGGTSYPGYCRWIGDGMPLDRNKSNYRGAVAWLIWGGDSAYKWLKTKKIRKILKTSFPNRKESKHGLHISLDCSKS